MELCLYNKFTIVKMNLLTKLICEFCPINHSKFQGRGFCMFGTVHWYTQCVGHAAILAHCNDDSFWKKVFHTLLFWREFSF